MSLPKVADNEVQTLLTKTLLEASSQSTAAKNILFHCLRKELTRCGGELSPATVAHACQLLETIYSAHESPGEQSPSAVVRSS